MENKKCHKCGEVKTIEHFVKNKGTKDGYENRCNECRKLYYQLNKEKILEKKKVYYAENKDAINKYKKQYYKDNKDYFAVKAKQHREKNRDKIIEYLRNYNKNNKEKGIQYRNANKEKIARYKREWYLKNKDRIDNHRRKYIKENEERFIPKRKLYYKNNKEKISEYHKQYAKTHNGKINLFKSNTKRRKAFKESTIKHGFITTSQWKKCKDYFENACCYCGGSSLKLAKEHFIPLANEGLSDVTNILPSCQSCNSSKKDKKFESWYKTTENYTLERKEKIYAYLKLVSKNNKKEGD